ncbi:peptide chain release factor N(5)-glutamine methyltransferase [Candidatus Marinimicrobia bacterium]|nr:peptide chain release factor N(5)-glutamine methyltransferase [Candidatus Neomarinimicrobiota bacterium]MDA9735593.1 peptide chain release factor N(5)-glutamine methyltransferase [Candidatus Neomarinimicrobiota bacterium]
MTLLKEYLKSQILKLEGTQVQEIQAKSNILVQHYFKISKADLYIKDIPLSAKDIINLDSMFAQLFQNKPVQYIIGETYFYNDKFLTPPGVFIPRPESELLVDCAVEFLSKSKDNLKIIDFCTGSGCILLSIAKKFPKHEYIGLDKSKLAIKTAKKNRELLGLKNIQFFNQDIFKYDQSKADLLLCNPPYLAKHEIDSLEQSVRDYDPLSALTDFKNGTSFYKYLISNFNKLVKKNGIMLLEIPFSAVTDDIILINKNFNTNKSFFYKDLEGKNRVIKIY